jgi:acid phosphatase (class B)
VTFQSGEGAMLKKTGLTVALICIVLVNFTAVAQEQSIKWVTLQDIAKSLENQPAMNVGFDIDDTVLFSSPGYYYGKQKYSPEDNSFLLKKEFWEEMNNGHDRFSIPKECARKLIELHKKRGDSIYFITGRTKTKTETLTELLARTFALENPNKVIFTSNEAKIKPIKENHIKIFYGDSDADIRAAQVNDIRAIRIIRARNSTHKPLPKNGSLGEEVLVNSDY